MSWSEQISHVHVWASLVTEILSRFRLGLNLLKSGPCNEHHRDAKNSDRQIDYSAIYWSHKLQKKCWHKDIPFSSVDCATSIVARLKLAPWTMTTFLPGWYEYTQAQASAKARSNVACETSLKSCDLQNHVPLTYIFDPVTKPQVSLRSSLRGICLLDKSICMSVCL